MISIIILFTLLCNMPVFGMSSYSQHKLLSCDTPIYSQYNPLPRDTPGYWPNWGGDLHNNRYASGETAISASTVGSLKVDWISITGRSVSCTITEYNGVLYYVDTAGFIYATSATTGIPIWRKSVQEIGLLIGSNLYSRTSPAIDPSSGTIIIGIQVGAYLAALSMATGTILWRTQLSDFVGAIITQSPTIYNGLSSNEEILAAVPGYECCVFVGKFFKVDLLTGTIVWSTPMGPSNGGSTRWGFRNVCLGKFTFH